MADADSEEETLDLFAEPADYVSDQRTNLLTGI
jgi:hypothetical protein